MFEVMNSRMNSIEQLIKMLLVNCVLNNEQTDKIEAETKQALKAILESLGIEKFNFYIIDNQNLLFVYLDSKISLNAIREIYRSIIKELHGIKAVLVFDKINGNRKKKLEQEKISFSVRSSEIKVF